ncbi:hypothetical protein [Paraburkholderia sp. MM5477-R1]|uniref:hypothetical protein n=1 Tax=Paraburkholderia sp. MM5477-R1 TaxID=2991062 RepID=UPI003D1EF33B
MTNDVIEVQQDSADLSPRNFGEMMQFAEMIAASGLAPKDYQGKPEACAVAMQWGNELGLKPMQSLQNIAVIGNRPALWGDAVLALVMSSPACKDVIEFYEHEDTADAVAVCIAQRHGKADRTARFSLADAKQAGLLGKDVWQKYPKRMLQMRARGFALRDQFPDVLRGLPIAELVREAIDMGLVEQVDAATGEVSGRHEAAGAASRAEAVKGRLRKPPKLRDVLAAIDSASDAQALAAAGDLAGRLTDEKEKQQAREHYQAKLNAEKTKSRSAPPSGTSPQADVFSPSYADVAAAIDAAERRRDVEALSAARDLIRSVADEGQRNELNTLFEAAMQRLDGSETEAAS